MSNILPNILTESQKLKKNDDHINKEVEVDYAKGDSGVVNTLDHAETLCENMISEDESLRVVCAIDNKVCGLFTKGTQSIYDMTPHKDEVCDLSGLVIDKVVIVFLGNTLLPTKEDNSVCDVDKFGTISLRPILSCILKLKPIQMDEQSAFLHRNLNVKVEDFPFVNMLKKILTKSCDKATHEKDHKRECQC